MKPRKIKELRVLLDSYRMRVENIIDLFGHQAIELRACITFLNAARRRFGLALKALNQESPYKVEDIDKDPIPDRADQANGMGRDGDTGPDDVVRLARILRRDIYTEFIHPLKMIVDGTGYKNSTYDRQIEIALNGMEESRMALGEFLGAVRDKAYEPVQISVDEDFGVDELKDFVVEWKQAGPVINVESPTLISRIY